MIEGGDMLRRLFSAFWLALFVLLVGSRLVQAEPAKDDKKTPPAKPIVAVFQLSGNLSESPADEALPWGGQQPVSLKDLVERMKKAGKDPQVKAVAILAN